MAKIYPLFLGPVLRFCTKNHETSFAVKFIAIVAIIAKMAKRYELPYTPWDLVADIFTQTRRTWRLRVDDRLMLNGVLWVLCSGAAWRDMPERFGPWLTVYQRFRDWRNCGAFDQMLKLLHIRLNEQGLIDLETWMIDSTAVRATRAS